MNIIWTYSQKTKSNELQVEATIDKIQNKTRDLTMWYCYFKFLLLVLLGTVQAFIGVILLYY